MKKVLTFNLGQKTSKSPWPFDGYYLKRFWQISLVSAYCDFDFKPDCFVRRQMTYALNLFDFQIYHFEQTTAEMSDQLTTVQTNCNHLEEEVWYCKNEHLYRSKVSALWTDTNEEWV